MWEGSIVSLHIASESCRSNLPHSAAWQNGPNFQQPGPFRNDALPALILRLANET